MGLLDFLGGLYQTHVNKKSQQRQNDFNAQQADLNRQFQAQEAEIARDWQEQQYNQYSSPAAMVRQYEDAGLNPALMYGQNLQGSTGSSPMPSGSAASGSAPTAGMPTGNILENIAGFAKLKAEIDNINADTFQKRAAVDKTISDIELNNQTISESLARIDKLKQETKSESLRQALIAAETLLKEEDKRLKSNQSINISYDNMRKQFEQSYKDKFGFYPASNVTEAVLQILGQSVVEIEYGIDKMSNFVKNLIK